MAAIVKEMGVGKGDRVLLYMPMVAEAAFAMLACARIGAIHSVVFGGFASVSLAQRIDDASPKVVITADAGSRGGDRLIADYADDCSHLRGRCPDEISADHTRVRRCSQSGSGERWRFCANRLTAGGLPHNIDWTWGCSSAGRAREWHSRGQGFNPPHLHYVSIDPLHLTTTLRLQTTTRS